MILLDLDHFKRVNDTHGHLAGDAALKRWPQIAVDPARAEDLVARYGGEEFVVLLRGIHWRGGTRRREAEVRDCDGPTDSKGRSSPIPISAGAASLAGCPDRSGR